MSDQKGVAPHLRKKAHEKKSTNRPSSIAPATNRANPTNSATNRASPIVPSGNTAHPTVPDIQALNSIARVASARKSSVTTANDAPIKTTRITVDPRVFSDDSAANHDTYHDSTAEAALTDHSLTNDLSDSNASPTLQSTPANAVVLYGIQQTLSPMEMIQHETVRTLQSLLDAVQAQLNATNARCGQLSAENEDLRRQISERVQDSEEPENSGILGETLVGYESSEVAEDEVVSDDPLADSSTQAQLSENERLDTVTQILELQNAKQADFENTIAKQAAQIEALQRRVEEDQKRRASEPEESICPIDCRQLLARVSELEKKSATSKSTQNAISVLQARMELKRRQHERIDNAIIREDLLSFYEILSDQIADFHDMEDGFRGTEDELWALRDRVLCRLAIFEKYGEAVEEAKAAMEYKGNGKRSQVSSKGSVGGGSKSRW